MTRSGITLTRSMLSHTPVVAIMANSASATGAAENTRLDRMENTLIHLNPHGAR